MQNNEGVEIYMDGSCMNNGSEEAIAGAGIFSPDEPEPNRAIRLPREMRQTNQTGEIIGIKEALEAVDKETEITINSDLKTCIGGLTKHLSKWEDARYMDIENAHEIQVTAARLRERKAPTNFRWVKGHVGIDGNEEADVLANNGREKDCPDVINMAYPQTLKVSGVKLNKLTQSLAYKFIRRKKMSLKKFQENLNRDPRKSTQVEPKPALRKWEHHGQLRQGSGSQYDTKTSAGK
jgi:ribonuclease HI